MNDERSEPSARNNLAGRLAKSGRQIGHENLDRLRTYLEKLTACGEPLPLRGGQPNLSVIASACGFDRQVLYKNEPAKALFEQFLSKMGFAPRPRFFNPSPGDALTHNDAEIQVRDRRIKHLEEKLLVREAEIDELRRIVIVLTKESRYLRAHSEHLMETGRRVIP